MFRQVINFVINGIGMCFNVTKTFIIDRIGNLNITYYHFIVFAIFMAITIRLIGFIKGIQEIEEEKEENFNRKQKQAYNEWLREHASTPRRYKK